MTDFNFEIVSCGALFWSGWSLVRLQLREKGGSGLESGVEPYYYIWRGEFASSHRLPQNVKAVSMTTNHPRTLSNTKCEEMIYFYIYIVVDNCILYA